MYVLIIFINYLSYSFLLSLLFINPNSYRYHISITKLYWYSYLDEKMMYSVFSNKIKSIHEFIKWKQWEKYFFSYHWSFQLTFHLCWMFIFLIKISWKGYKWFIVYRLWIRQLSYHLEIVYQNIKFSINENLLSFS
jgi:hypothetical protein